jgi:hypothetical protein
MLIGAALFVSTFAVGFGYLVFDALHSGKLRGFGWSVGKAKAPTRYWAGVFAYGVNALIASAFAILLAASVLVG